MQAARVLVVSPRSFCAGVEMAVKALGWLVLRHGAPVFCVHEVVHNRRVVDRFRDLGVVFVDDLGDVPPGAPVLLSAHGSAPGTADHHDGIVVDAVCPLVTKVHHELRARAAEGRPILYVGHPGHDEATAAMAVAPEVTTLVRSPADLPPALHRPPAVLAQTTLALDEWQAVVDAARSRYGRVWVPPRADVCYATTNRQAAVRAVAPQADAFVVVGSPESANTAALASVAVAAGCPQVVRVDGASELPAGVEVRTAAVTAGASAPESAVADVVAALGGDVEHVAIGDEHAYFPPPPALRRLLADDPVARRLLERDRSLSADEFLTIVEATVHARAA
jgi:4-hydroxy-3-methylbut-2-enyl diphosphate reductase